MPRATNSKLAFLLTIVYVCVCSLAHTSIHNLASVTIIHLMYSPEFLQSPTWNFLD